MNNFSKSGRFSKWLIIHLLSVHSKYLITRLLSVQSICTIAIDCTVMKSCYNGEKFWQLIACVIACVLECPVHGWLLILFTVWSVERKVVPVSVMVVAQPRQWSLKNSEHYLLLCCLWCAALNSELLSVVLSWWMNDFCEKRVTHFGLSGMTVVFVIYSIWSTQSNSFGSIHL